MKEVAKQRIKISPVAKKIAKSENLDIKALVGTGPGGRITKVDVLKAIEERVTIPEVLEQEESKSNSCYWYAESNRKPYACKFTK